MTMKKLYKKDRKGNMRVWWAETKEDGYRTHSGLVDGKTVVSGWVYPTEKNIGKTNATTVKEQVDIEVEAMYVYQKHQGKYHENESDTDDGASFVECMLAEKFDPERHDSYPYLAQPKLNGARGLGVDSDTLQTRNGKLHVSCPHILKDIEKFQEEFPDYILDGELYNHELHDNFEGLMSLIRKSKNVTEQHMMETEENVFFYVYDVITPQPLPVEERIKFLQEHVYNKFEYIRTVEAKLVNNLDEVLSLLDSYLDDKYEGLMLRKLGSTYQSGRTNDLVKVKKFLDQEVTIIGFIEGKGSWAGRAKSATIRLDNGLEQESGIKGDFDFTAELLENEKDYINTRATVTYPEITKKGKIKFPIITYFWKGERDV